MTRFFMLINNIFGVLGSWLQSPLLLILRLFFGIGFMLAGLSKIQDISKFVDVLTSFNIPSPQTAAWLAALSETICGFLLAIGFLSRIAAIPLIIVMVVAYATAHVDSVYQLVQDPKIFVSQSAFNFLLTSLLVFAFGPGLLSVDAILNMDGRKQDKSSK